MKMNGPRVNRQQLVFQRPTSPSEQRCKIVTRADKKIRIMLGSIEKADFKPREAAAGECANYERGGPEYSGEPCASMRQVVPHGQQKSDTSKSSECDPRLGSSQK